MAVVVAGVKCIICEVLRTMSSTYSSLFCLLVLLFLLCPGFTFLSASDILEGGKFQSFKEVNQLCDQGHPGKLRERGLRPAVWQIVLRRIYDCEHIGDWRVSEYCPTLQMYFTIC